MKCEPLVFTKNETNSSVRKKISDRVLEFTLEEVVQELSKDFVFQEETIKTIYSGVATGQGIILYGPGGFSKTVLIKAFCELLGIPIITKISNIESTVEELLGLPNMKKLLNDSVLETAFEHSVFSKVGLLCLDEFLDVRPSVAASLKDVITERGLREGDKFKESLISSIIITGNKNPDELSIDDSLKAFYKERFPNKRKVIWKDFSEEAYMKFFKVYYKDKIYNENIKEFILLSKLCSNSKDIISPRIAADAGDTMLKLGIGFIDTISEIDTSELNKYDKEVEEKYNAKKQKILIDKFKKKLDSISVYINNSNSTSEYLMNYIILKHLKEQLPKEVTDELANDLIYLHKLIEEIQEKIITTAPKLFKFQPLIDQIKSNEFLKD